MQDRVSVNPGRVLVTPENGGAAYYATITRADNPTQEGTPLNKASLLRDATAALFGLGVSAVPDDVLTAIKSLIDGANANANARARIATGSYTGTGTYGSSNQNTLTFDFVPKLVIIRPVSEYNLLSKMFVWVNGSDRPYIGYEGSMYNDTIKSSLSGTTLSWYSGRDAERQSNVNSCSYAWVAIG